jgi:hypothetical protein
MALRVTYKGTMAHSTNYTKKDYPRGPRKRKFDPETMCGRRANDGNPCCLDKGHGTDHLGEGPCKFHGGNKVHTNVYRLIKKASATTEALDLVRENVEDPMDLRPELEMLRAMVIEFHERYEEFKNGLIAFSKSFDPSVTMLMTSNSPMIWAKAIAELRGAVNQRPVQVIDVSFTSVILDRIGKMVERIHKINTDGSLTPERVRMYRDALVLAVMEECTPEQAAKIADKLEKI